jgi:pseudouridylate synthase
MIKLSEAVDAALTTGRPVVALESTIIAHGMPYPRNLETALEVEATIRSEGAVPATIAVLSGEIHAGLSRKELEYLAGADRVAKASRRDLPMIFANRSDAATTVAATMIGAAMAGIRIFATGGIGGVHRGAETSFDISADLQELARTSVAVVSAGAKSILDIGLTLEYLETQGVPVLGYGTDEFPAFYTRESGFGVDCSVYTPAEIARILAAKWQAGLDGGVLIANPIPPEHSMDRQIIDAIIDTAVRDADERGIRGKELTPYLLSRVADLSNGESLESNIALVKNNAALAAQIAVALAGGETG